MNHKISENAVGILADRRILRRFLVAVCLAVVICICAAAILAVRQKFPS